MLIAGSSAAGAAVTKGAVCAAGWPREARAVDGRSGRLANDLASAGRGCGIAACCNSGRGVREAQAGAAAKAARRIPGTSHRRAAVTKGYRALMIIMPLSTLSDS